TQGIEIGQFRAGDDPVPIKLRSRDGENFPIEQLPSVNVYGNQGPAVPLMQLANIDIEWQPGAILRRDFSRYATVSANLLDGVGHEQVLAYVLPKIAEASESGELPSTVTTKLGGEADASGEANSALLGAAPLGLMMLLFFLLLEFNSFRRVLIIMATVPLVMIGVIPGLVITGSPFGFNSMVGCIALVGIVVNNAIVLIDVIDARLKEGGDLTLAIKEAVARRTRPIILTTFTTVAGLSPLTVTSATAWPPMAWAIISGLLASTVLTLVVIPALCKLLLSSRKNKAQPKAAATVAMAVIAVFGLSYGESSYAQIGQYPGEEELQHIDQVVDYEGARDYANMTPITLLESIRMAAERPQVKAEVARTYARKHEAHELFRKAWLPSLTVTAYAAKADRESNATFPPAGPGAPPTVISVAERERYGGTVEVRQTLFNAANGIYRLQAAKLAAQAQGLITYRQGELATTLSSPAFLRALSFDAQVEAATAALASQKLQLKDAQSLAKTGRLTDADLQLAQVQLLQAEHHLHELKSEQRINLSDFARTIGSPVLRRPELPVARVWNLITIPSFEEAFEFTRETREDFRAQRLQLKALEKQRAAVGAEAIPSVGLTAQYTRNEGQTFQSEEEAFVGAQITWQPLAGGARASKRKALANEYAALKQELLESERTLWFDLLESAEHFRLAHEQVELTEKAVSASQAALENQQKREKAGLASAAALAGAQARADEHRASLKRAQIAVIGHWLHFHVVMGSTVEDALNKYGPGIEALNMQ
ncbi:MAG: efflux RND transporter permease subunit, partial [Gammaproteobacteria bacterium]|nr:efflux RND transporter permease subunit [Gammaproteobacteria bacterium]